MNIVEKNSENGIKLIYEPEGNTHSGFSLIFIPSEPDQTFDVDIAKSILKLLIGHYPNCLITIELNNAISFVDCGSNLELVRCQHCGDQLGMSYWQGLMNKAFETNFDDLRFTTKCCNKESNLNDLNYHFECGFAKTILQVEDPEYDDATIKELLSKLEETVDVEFKVIYSKY
jgi:hypothetical protein